jgi:tetratricopeptide (TPR) repeat protein
MEPETAARLEEARRLDRAADYGRAVLAYKLVLRADPGCLAAKVDLAGLLMVLGRFEESLALSLEVLEARPGVLAAIQNLVGALMGLERYEEADQRCRSLLEQDPACAPAHLGLGMSLACRERHREAEDAFQRALELDPADGRARGALLRSQIKQRAWDRVYPTWMDIARLDMEGPKGAFEKAFIHLTFGELEQGWELYESRWESPNTVGPRLSYPQPLWDGAPFPGRTLLLHYEQGFGDTLMFIRYAALARERGGRVVALVQPQLLPVLRSCPWVDEWVTFDDPLPPFDVHLPLLSLPRLAGTRLDSIPAPVPYLRAPAGTCPAAGAVAATPNLKVGLVWAGSTIHKHDVLRTLPVGALQPLSEIPGVDWYSLQLGYGGGLPWEGIRDLGPLLGNFGDTAQVLEKLDLLITVDTAVGHLAGALGRPAWLMLALVPDWRWLLDRETSPWYPTLRLFAQRSHDDWPGVVARIAESLNQLMNIRRGTC